MMRTLLARRCWTLLHHPRPGTGAGAHLSTLWH